MNDNYLAHHGILGQKWGVRRFQNPDGSLTDAGRRRQEGSSRVLKSGYRLKRVSAINQYLDKTALKGNRTYFSTNDKDHKVWTDMFGEGEGQRLKAIYDATYETMGDLYIASPETAGKALDEVRRKHPIQTSLDYGNAFGRFGKRDLAESYKSKMTKDWEATMNIAAFTKTGNRVIAELKKQGYNGVEDSHGINTTDAKAPVVIFDPGKNVKIKEQKKDESYVEKAKERYKYANLNVQINTPDGPETVKLWQLPPDAQDLAIKEFKKQEGKDE